MITARFIHTVVEGKDTLLTTANFDETISEENIETIISSSIPGDQIFYKNNLITYTNIYPDSEPNGRSYVTTDGIICRFTDEELVSHLKPEEKLMLLKRIQNKLDLISRMNLAQTQTKLVTPLPEVKI